ncbi:MAG: GNAT family N-acetyltransferase [Spirochaetes bacterium]|nr:GNAT family N-acetyltransferase [Spirochaetota bacterium]
MIKGNKLILRTIKESDVKELHELSNDISARGDFFPVGLSSEIGFQNLYKENGFWGDNMGAMVICNMNQEIVGEIAYFKGVRYDTGYEIGYRIFKDEDKGKGYCTEALKLMTAYLFELKNIQRLEVCFDKGNIGSLKVAEKCGYKYEGTKRNGVFIKGKYCDLEIYSIIRDEVYTLNSVMK